MTDDGLTDETDPLYLTKLENEESDYLESADKETESVLEEGRKRELDDAVEHGLRAMQELLEVKEPKWYQMGEYRTVTNKLEHTV